MGRKPLRKGWLCTCASCSLTTGLVHSQKYTHVSCGCCGNDYKLVAYNRHLLSGGIRHLSQGVARPCSLKAREERLPGFSLSIWWGWCPWACGSITLIFASFLFVHLPSRLTCIWCPPFCVCVRTSLSYTPVTGLRSTVIQYEPELVYLYKDPICK